MPLAPAQNLFLPEDVMGLVCPDDLWKSLVWARAVPRLADLQLGVTIVGYAQYFASGDCAFAIALGFRLGPRVVGSLCYRDDASEPLPRWRRDREFRDAAGFAAAYAQMTPRTSWPTPHTAIPVPLGYRRTMGTHGTLRRPRIFMTLVQQVEADGSSLAVDAAAKSLHEAWFGSAN